MKERNCVTLGHEWTVTSAPGWFLCKRIVGTKVSKQRTVQQSVYCGAVSYCPGCLRARLPDGYPVLMCQSHASMNIQHLPVVAAPPGVPCSPPSARQHSLW